MRDERNKLLVENFAQKCQVEYLRSKLRKVESSDRHVVPKSVGLFSLPMEGGVFFGTDTII